VRRSWTIAITAAVAAGGFAVPTASAGSGDQADSLAAAKHAPTSAGSTWLHERLGSPSDQDWFRFSMPSAGRALVTLGHLPRNYDLALFSSSGQRLARSQQPGRRFEQVYRSFAAGDVFARVTASGEVKSSVAYALKFRPLADAMVIAEQRNVGDTSGFDIKGELLNNTSDWLDVLRLHVTWLDKNGHSVGTQDEGIIPGPVPPRKRVQFSVEETNPPAGAVGYRITADTRSTNRRTPQNLQMTPGERTESATQRVYRGTIKNTTSETVRGLYPTVIEYDRLGRAIAFAFDVIDALAPGETADYSAAVNTKDLPRLNGIRQFYSVTKP
jgi:hypothetical protein